MDAAPLVVGVGGNGRRARFELVERRHVVALARRGWLGLRAFAGTTTVGGGAADRAAAGFVTQQRAHRVLEVGELSQHPAEDLAQRLGHPLRRGRVHLSADLLGGTGDERFHRADRVAEHREDLVVAQDRPPPGGLAQRLEGNPARHLSARPGVVVELLQLGQIIDDRRARPADDRDPPRPVDVPATNRVNSSLPHNVSWAGIGIGSPAGSSGVTSSTVRPSTTSIW